MNQLTRTARFAVALGAALGAHDLGDYHVQTDHQAQHKGCDTHPNGGDHTGCTRRSAQLACLRHVATYTVTHGVALAAALAVTGVRLRPARVAAGLALTAVTHYVIDRRQPLKRFAEATGHGGFYANGGAPLLDQAAHKGLLFVSALVMSGGR